MTLSALTIDQADNFIPLLKDIQSDPWPDIPFKPYDARENIIAHIESDGATVLCIDEGEAKAILVLDTTQLIGNDDTVIAVETAWGTTNPAPKHAAKRLLTEAKRWASDQGISHLQIHLGGSRKGAARFIKILGGEVIHTAGIWRL